MFEVEKKLFKGSYGVNFDVLNKRDLVAEAAGRKICLNPCVLAVSIMFRMPLTGFKLPSRDNSPVKKRPLTSSSRSCLARIKILIAMGKSREEPLLMRSAGARLMTILCLGKEKY